MTTKKTLEGKCVDFLRSLPDAQQQQGVLLVMFSKRFQSYCGTDFKAELKRRQIGKMKKFFAQHPDKFQVFGPDYAVRVRLAETSKPKVSSATKSNTTPPGSSSADLRSASTNKKVPTPPVCSSPNVSKASSTGSSSTPESATSSSDSKSLCEIKAQPSSRTPPPSAAIPKRGKYVLLDTEAKVRNAMPDLQKAGRVAVDCEGVNLGREGRLCLLQVAFEAQAGGKEKAQDEREEASVSVETQVVIFDLVLLPQFPSELKSLLQDGSVPKVMHDSRKDTEALYFQYGVTVKNVHDTQVAFGLLERLTNGMSGPRIGLDTLLKRFGLPGKANADEIAKRWKRGPHVFETRPLDGQFLDYSAADVAFLLPLYDVLMERSQAAVFSAEARDSNRNAEFYLPSTYSSAASLPLGAELFVTKKGLAASAMEAINMSSMGTNEAATRELEILLSALPPELANVVQGESGQKDSSILEIVLDLGRPVCIRFSNGEESYIGEVMVQPDQILRSIFRAKFPTFEEPAAGDTHYLSQLLTCDNRTGLRETLHRISAIRGRDGSALGITIRVAKQIPGVAYLLFDILQKVCDLEKPKSILLLGRPGVGKTTLLRDIIHILAEEFHRRVMIVDTSDEIAGDGETPHACIGRARRMSVQDRQVQHETMVQAVQNHNPQVLVIDEIGTSREADAAKQVSQRGVSLVATAHGIELGSLLKDSSLAALVGGVQPVILGDQAASKAKGEMARNTSIFHDENQESSLHGKTRLERKGAPTFGVLVEVREWAKWRIHTNVAESVDRLLEGKAPSVAERWIDEEGYCRAKRINHELRKDDWLSWI